MGPQGYEQAQALRSVRKYLQKLADSDAEVGSLAEVRRTCATMLADHPPDQVLAHHAVDRCLARLSNSLGANRAEHLRSGQPLRRLVTLQETRAFMQAL